ncbi:palmitoyl-protein thioesterase 1 [Cylas formicarius]|uniref:palmitoyl-protein thioesterase 1 n=1 Tax=Cylas formicarius TaxID=197179 RepID=UPI002958780E|nr:palmitoyl-protein thioesterase 1 [Cylas formicarius]
MAGGRSSYLLSLAWVVCCLAVVFAQNEVGDAVQPTPIVMWHGMGDSCCFPFSLGEIKNRLNDSLPGVYVNSLQIGDSIIKDMENGYLLHPDKQVALACDIIRKDERLQDGYNAIGFSQGSQFLRGLVQRCPNPPMKNLISLGGQHQGVYGLPNCGSLSSTICDYLRQLLNKAAYLEWVQNSLVQATYWHDPLNEEEYRNHSTFLADINNERVVNQTYIKNLQTLQNFVMVKFANDTMVQPVDSEWFGFYKPGQAVQVQSLEESQLYTEDRLGLKRMNEDSKLKFISIPTNHLRFEWDWFEENIVKSYLKT